MRLSESEMSKWQRKLYLGENKEGQMNTELFIETLKRLLEEQTRENESKEEK